MPPLDPGFFNADGSLPTATDMLGLPPRMPDSNVATPMYQKGILADLVGPAGGTLGYVGSTLDKLGRPVRHGIASYTNPGYEGDWTEYFSWVPFSDAAGLTDPMNTATGKDITQSDNPALNFATEVALDPGSYVGGILGKSLTKGGQILDNMGVLGDVTRAVAGSKGRFLSRMPDKLTNAIPGRGDALGGIQKSLTRTEATVGEGLTALKDTIRRESPDRADVLIDQLDNEFVLQAKKLGYTGENWENILDQPMQTFLSVTSPSPIPLPGIPSMWEQGINVRFPGDKLASSAADYMGDFVKRFPGVTQARQLLSKPTGGYQSQFMQDAVGQRSLEKLRDVEAKLEFDLHDPAMTLEDAQIGLGMPRQLMDRFTEFRIKSLHLQLPGVKREFMRTLQNSAEHKVYDMLERRGVFDALYDVDRLIQGIPELRQRAGLNMEELEDVHVAYAPRQIDTRYMPDDIKDRNLPEGSTLKRQSYLTELPGGVETINRMSQDPKISGYQERFLSGTNESYGQKHREALMQYLIDNYPGAIKTHSTQRMLDVAGQRFGDELETFHGFAYPPNIQQNLNKYYKQDIRVPGSLPQAPPKGFNPDAPKLVKDLTPEQKAHMEDLVDFVSGLDRRYSDPSTKTPIFKQSPVENARSYLSSNRGAIESANLFYDAVAQSALTKEKIVSMGHDPKQYRTLKSLLLEEDMGMSSPIYGEKALPGGAVERYEQTKAINPQAFANLRQRIEHDSNAWSTYMGLKGKLNSEADLANLMIHEDQYNDFKRFMGTHVNPSGIQEEIAGPLAKAGQAIGRVWVPMLNATKRSLTQPFVTYHERNLVGGQYSNAVAGMFSADSVGIATDLRLGNIPKGIKDKITFSPDNLPPRLAQQLGQDGKFASDALAAEAILAELPAYRVWSNETIHASLGEGWQIGKERLRLKEGQLTPESRWLPKGAQDIQPRQRVGDFLKDTYGRIHNQKEYGSWGTTAFDMTVMEMLGLPNAIGALAGKGGYGGRTGWNPKHLLTSPEVEVSKLYSIGNQLGNDVEFFNRVSPYIHERMAGKSPVTAAQRVASAQVDYSMLSDFEKKYVKNIYPFYPFTRGMLPHVLKEIIGSPAGPMSQHIKGVARQRRGDDPELTRVYDMSERQRQGAGLWLSGGGDRDPNVSYIQNQSIYPWTDPMGLFDVGSSLRDTAQGTFQSIYGRLAPQVQSTVKWSTGLDPARGTAWHGSSRVNPASAYSKFLEANNWGWWNAVRQNLPGQRQSGVSGLLDVYGPGHFGIPPHDWHGQEPMGIETLASPQTLPGWFQKYGLPTSTSRNVTRRDDINIHQKNRRDLLVEGLLKYPQYFIQSDYGGVALKRDVDYANVPDSLKQAWDLLGRLESQAKQK